MDVTQEQLREAHAKCLDELEAVRREVQENEEAARAARDELQYFVYAASHDFQQPLRAIGTHAQLLQRELSQNERVRELTTTILDNATRMNTLVRDLLTYSRTGNVSDLAPLKLNGPLQWALLKLADLTKEAGAQITAGNLPEALGDEQQIVTVFEQLITNSIRYKGSESPRIEVSGEAGDDSCTISVRDNGAGIKAEYQEKVFQPFQRLHSKDIPGSGLGLAICRKIVRAHHGKIWVESDGEHGSAVKFTLPI
jgi:light-regulated signal transduction histidine kinase (bacteriophytochrome)